MLRTLRTPLSTKNLQSWQKKKKKKKYLLRDYKSSFKLNDLVMVIEKKRKTTGTKDVRIGQELQSHRSAGTECNKTLQKSS